MLNMTAAISVSLVVSLALLFGVTGLSGPNDIGTSPGRLGKTEED